MIETSQGDRRKYYAISDTRYCILAWVNREGVVIERNEFTPSGRIQKFTRGVQLADANHDGVGDGDDGTLFGLNWGTSGHTPGTNGDLDYDGDVDTADGNLLTPNLTYGNTNDPKLLNPAAGNASGLTEKVAGVSGGVISPHGYQGLRHDPITDNIYNRARNISTLLAIFMERDPLGFVDGMNNHTLYQMIFEGLDPSGMEIDAATQRRRRRSPDYEGPLTERMINRFFDRYPTDFPEDWEHDRFNFGPIDDTFTTEIDIELIKKRIGTTSDREHDVPCQNGRCATRGEVVEWTGSVDATEVVETWYSWDEITGRIRAVRITYHFSEVTYRGELAAHGQSNGDGTCHYRFESVSLWAHVDKIEIRIAYLDEGDSDPDKVEDLVTDYNWTGLPPVIEDYPLGPGETDWNEPDRREHPGRWVDWINHKRYVDRYNDPRVGPNDRFDRVRYGLNEETRRDEILFPDDWPDEYR